MSHPVTIWKLLFSYLTLAGSGEISGGLPSSLRECLVADVDPSVTGALGLVPGLLELDVVFLLGGEDFLVPEGLGEVFGFETPAPTTPGVPPEFSAAFLAAAA